MTAPDQFSLRIAGRREELPKFAALLHDLHASGRLPDEVLHALCIVGDEIFNNLLAHAQGGGRDHEIGILLRLFPAHVELELSDDGPPFDPIAHTVEAPSGELEQMSIGGLGLLLVKSLVDDMSYQYADGQNLLRITRAFVQAQPPVLPAAAFLATRRVDRRRAEPQFPIVVDGQRIDHDRRRADRRQRPLGGHVPLFNGVDLPALDAVLADCPILELTEPRVLIRKGEKNVHLYILLSGELLVQLDLDDPSPIHIGPGESVGEISLIDGEPASAYVVAMPGARFIVIADRVFWERIIPLPGVARNLMRAQSKRLRANNEMMLAKVKQDLLLQQMEKDLSVAADIQRGMLPRSFPLFPDRPQIDLHATMNPAREIGGDFYDAFLADRNHLVFAVGDVSGKGVSAALFMVRSMTLLRTEARQAAGPLEMLARINRLLCAENPQSMFVTLCVGVLDMDSGHVRLGNAGHLPPARGAAGNWRLLEPSCSSLLGVWDDAQFAETQFRLAVGDTLLVHSDGVTEARAPGGGEQFGEARLIEALRGADGSARQVVERVVEAVSGYADGDKPFDDVTVLALRYNGVPAR